MRVVTLLSDFGSASPYPAAMKAVIASRVEVSFLDISHDVRRHDVREAAFLLASVAPHCPAGTVHLAIVDPGVGTSRRGLLVAAGGQTLIGPDSGLLMPAARRLGRPAFYALDPGLLVPGAPATFHGRDFFSPAAVRVLRGEPPVRLGLQVDDPVDLSFEEGSWEDGVLAGEVLYVDRFGNLITNIPSELLEGHDVLQLGAAPPGPAGRGKANRALVARARRTYGEGELGELILVPGSEGLVEVAVREGDARQVTGLQAGSPVRLAPLGRGIRQNILNLEGKTAGNRGPRRRIGTRPQRRS